MVIKQIQKYTCHESEYYKTLRFYAFYRLTLPDWNACDGESFLNNTAQISLNLISRNYPCFYPLFTIRHNKNLSKCVLQGEAFH
jgi:hypothetical protein